MVAHIPAYETIEGHGVRLEPYTPAHLPGLTAALGRPEVFAGGWGGGSAAARSGDHFAAWLPQYLPVGRAHVYVVRDLSVSDDLHSLIGTSTVLDLNLATESAHIGYTAYAPEVWGSSVNPTCKLLLLGHLFDHGFGRVKLQADVLNARSRAGIAKLGATFEGIARREQPRADGSWRDTAVYSILCDEWPEVRERLLARVRGTL